ncbi:PilW family protein [Piscinibacter gummiphilus]|uniref:PilW family protein n=1 Tax=Piscinibacter gummiphilus TaxID=946333 RepID=A0ABZ0CWF7_9BURK|nr:PilW family protein [Piscinibacter gummiphilus]WOB09302.1 PilW family protein [Piscinibacter gummiphilus]
MHKTAPSAAKGFSLIELLVAMAIGLVVTLVITRVLMLSEGQKRTSTALNDTVQSGAYSSFVLERAIRQAGTGYTQKLTELFGCRINAARVSTGGPLLPATAPFDAPFAAASQMRRLAPVLIEKNAADSGGQTRGDVITVLSGAGGKSEMPMRATSFNLALPMSFSLPFTGEYSVGDLVLIGGDRAAGGQRECMVQQVSAIAGKSLILGGDYFSATGSTVNYADFATMSVVYAAQIGKGQPPLPAPQTPPNPPLFQMFGVGDNNTLFALDLLKTGSTAAANQPQPVSDNVVEVRALYGIDANFDHMLDTWWDPATSPFTYAELTSGSGVALADLKRITSIRLGLITRSPVQEKLRDDGTPVSPEQVVLFPGLTSSGGAQLQYVRTLTADERNFRYRTYETIIPLRNMQFAPLP